MLPGCETTVNVGGKASHFAPYAVCGLKRQSGGIEKKTILGAFLELTQEIELWDVIVWMRFRFRWEAW